MQCTNAALNQIAFLLPVIGSNSYKPEQTVKRNLVPSLRAFQSVRASSPAFALSAELRLAPRYDSLMKVYTRIFVTLEERKVRIKIMERVINLHIEKLPEGYYLATSESVQGLIAQGRTITETIEIAKDVAKKLIEAQEDKISSLNTFEDSFDYPLVVGF